MKASFMQRLFAYLIDIVIVAIVVGFVGMFIPNNNGDELIELNEQLVNAENAMMEAMSSGNTDSYKDSLNDVIDVEYKISRASVLSESISFVIVFAYFVILQFMLKGKTVGKMAMGIKVVDKKNREPSFWVIFLRTFIVQGILTSFISLITIIMLSKNVYVMFNMLFSSIISIFVIICAIMVLYRKDKRGLHDMMAGSLVIKDE